MAILQMVKDAGLRNGDARLGAHIAACRNATLPGDRLEFFIGTALVGYIGADIAAALPGTREANRLTMTAAEARGLNTIARNLAPRFGYRVRDEDFDVRAHIGGDVLTTLDRGALPAFGVIGVGIHLNGYVRRPDGLYLWIAERSPTKKLDPGKLDNIVGGGVSAGYSPWDTLIKEAAEEASLDAATLAGATEVSRIDYNMARPEGLRRDHLVCYDLELPETFTPRPADDEVERFILMQATEALSIMASGDRFKFNVNLVMIDFMLRHGVLNDPQLRATLAAMPAQRAES